MKIALLIDIDNISPNNIENIFDILNGYGEIKIAEAFGRSEKTNSRNWIDIANEYDMVLKNCGNDSKNSTDFTMTFRGGEILSRYRHLDCFCIISGDADFIHLITQLQNANKYVIAMGAENTARKIKNNCDKFFNLNQIYYFKKSDDELLEEIQEAISECSFNNRAHLGQVKKYLEDNFEFELSDYEYDKFSDFIRSFNEFEVDGTYIILEKPKIDARQLKQDTRLMNMLRNAISDCADDDNWANIGKVNRYLINNHDFDCQSYGYDKISDFFKEINLFYVDRNWVSIKKVIENQ